MIIEREQFTHRCEEKLKGISSRCGIRQTENGNLMK